MRSEFELIEILKRIESEKRAIEEVYRTVKNRNYEEVQTITKEFVEKIGLDKDRTRFRVVGNPDKTYKIVDFFVRRYPGAMFRRDPDSEVLVLQVLVSSSGKLGVTDTESIIFNYEGKIVLTGLDPVFEFAEDQDPAELAKS